jgi:hypothetical protein
MSTAAPSPLPPSRYGCETQPESDCQTRPSSLSPLLLVVWRRSGACIARPTRKGYRVVSRPRRTPRGASWASDICGEYLTGGTSVHYAHHQVWQTERSR